MTELYPFLFAIEAVVIIFISVKLVKFGLKLLEKIFLGGSNATKGYKKRIR